jgi:NitT/TauT family transport system permease protein
VAIQQANIKAILYAIATMFIVIALYDQLMFRPILKWAEKFKFDIQPDEKPTRAWFTSLLQRARLMHHVGHFISVAGDAFINMRWAKRQYIDRAQKQATGKTRIILVLFYSVVFVALIAGLYIFVHFIFATLGWHDLLDATLRCFGSAARVMATIIISSLVWVPIGVWIGQNATLTKWAQPIVQFCASFPANLIYPLAVLLIIKYNLNVDIWVTGLMILGAQWYILFNVISGTATLPKEIYNAAQNFGVHGWLWWRRIILPGIFPYYITGAITAAGGAWNLTIVTEFVGWGTHVFKAYGLGSYITEYTNDGDFHRVALGIGVMCIFVLVFNWLLWRPLYNLAQDRFKIG